MVAMIEHATIGALSVLGVPVKLSDTPGAVRTPPPRLGEHTDAVLARLWLQRRRDRRFAASKGDLTVMEISDVRKRLLQTVERAKLQAAERRARNDEATSPFGPLLRHIAVPLVRQVAQALRAENHLFNVFTPSGSVRLMSERNAEDFIELFLDTTGPEPRVVGRTRRSRGSRVLESEEALGAPGALSEEDVLAFLLRALEGFVER